MPTHMFHEVTNLMLQVCNLDCLIDPSSL